MRRKVGKMNQGKDEAEVLQKVPEILIKIEGRVVRIVDTSERERVNGLLVKEVAKRIRVIFYVESHTLLGNAHKGGNSQP